MNDMANGHHQMAAAYPLHHQQQQHQEQQHHHHSSAMIPPSQYGLNNQSSAGYYLPQTSVTDAPDLALPSGGPHDVQKPDVPFLGLDENKLFNHQSQSVNQVSYNAQPSNSSFLDYDNHEIDETALQNFIKFEESLENLNASISSYKMTSNYQPEAYSLGKQAATNPFQQQIDNLFVLDEEDEESTSIDTANSRYGEDDRSSSGKLGSYHYWHHLNASKLEQNEF